MASLQGYPIILDILQVESGCYDLPANFLYLIGFHASDAVTGAGQTSNGCFELGVDYFMDIHLGSLKTE